MPHLRLRLWVTLCSLWLGLFCLASPAADGWAAASDDAFVAGYATAVLDICYPFGLLRDWVNETLGEVPVAAAPGVLYEIGLGAPARGRHRALDWRCLRITV